MSNRPRIVLASASPRRQELMQLMGLSFEVIPSDFDESSVVVWPPEEHVMQLAAEKAADIAERIGEGIVVGADTVVVADDEILGKPIDPRDARRMLERLSGRSHFVYTGVSVLVRASRKTSRILREYERTEVRFAPLTNQIIEAYVATGEPLDKAGAYGIQERGSVLIEGIIGDYFNVVGLPVYRLSRMLMEIGIPLFG